MSESFACSDLPLPSLDIWGKEAFSCSPRLLILGIGNPDRQDDGLAWHLINRLATYWGHSKVLDIGETLPVNEGLTLCTDLQLRPEMAEDLATYTHVCFVDAHTGALPKEICWQTLQAGFQPSPLSHHLTPQSCLALAEALYGRSPAGFLLSVRGYEFGFSRQLSERTQRLLDSVVNPLLRWLTPFLQQG
ncbi:MAG: hypothetical protein ACPLUL_05655 [Thermanaerothrix sp.]|uniref:hypothetical protein n=1 Tax=Thermanaerothrix sp. TaxID=2972675 RepID=UPI003C7E3193